MFEPTVKRSEAGIKFYVETHFFLLKLVISLISFVPFRSPCWIEIFYQKTIFYHNFGLHYNGIIRVSLLDIFQRFPLKYENKKFSINIL